MVRETLGQGYRLARKVVVAVVGGTVVLFGVALIALPGPALLVIPLGLGILAVEFRWARRWLRRARRGAEEAASRLRSKRPEPEGQGYTEPQRRE